MKHLSYILLFFTANLSYGQYTLDDSIKSHPYLNQVLNDQCSLYYGVYYEPQDMYYYENGLAAGAMINGGTIECFILQEQLKDTLRKQFNNDELFDIARFSKMPFYKIAAFELYSRTDYDKESLIDFLKSEKNDSIPEMYLPMPNSLTPNLETIRSKMLDIIDPTAERKIRKDSLNSYIMITVPKYAKSKPLKYEEFIELRGFINISLHLYNGMWREAVKPPTFILYSGSYGFGKIYLKHIGSAETEFELRGFIKVTNVSKETIQITSKASAHTVCLKTKYVIEPNERVFIEFKSLVELKNVGPSIERNITLQNTKKGENQLFKFNAQFINK